jgi:uncharacterized delta-60 repeat protein
MLGQAGIPDKTFGTNGFVYKNYSTHGDYIRDMVIQSDNKTIIAGFVNNDTTGNRTSAIMARYNTDGSADTSFGTKGLVKINMDSSCLFSGIALMSDGRIVAVGKISHHSGDYMGIYRFTSKGALDTSFNHSGMDSVLNAICGNVVVNSAGDIFIGGQSSYNYCIIKYVSAGYLDPTYGNSSGYTYLPAIGTGMFTNDAYISTLQLITMQNDGKILYPLQVNSNKGVSEMAVLRYNTDGSLDTLFGQKGIFRAQIDTVSDFANSAAVDASGNIILSGISADSGSKDERVALLRANSSGMIDTTFGNKGKLKTRILGYQGFPTPVAIQTDNKIVVASTWEDTATANSTAFAMMRFNSKGAIDTTFGKKGFDTTQLVPYCYLASMKISSANKIELAGSYKYAGSSSGPVSVTIRYTTGLASTGNINFSTDNNKLIISPNPVQNTLTLQYAIVDNQMMAIDLYDLQGRFVKSIQATGFVSAGNHMVKTDLSNLANGAYLVYMSNSKGEHISLKLVKE